MVNEAYSIMEETKTFTTILPNIETKIETTKLHWLNVHEYLNKINRDSNHFMDFLKIELPNKKIDWMSSDVKDGLIIHGKKQKNIEISGLAIKYVNNNVLCHSCKNSNTLLIKNDRIYEFKCNSCGFNKYL